MIIHPERIETTSGKISARRVALQKAPQLTGEKKPALGSGDEAPVVPLVPAGFCQLLFGNRAALGRRIKHTPLQITR